VYKLGFRVDSKELVKQYEMKLKKYNAKISMLKRTNLEMTSKFEAIGDENKKMKKDIAAMRLSSSTKIEGNSRYEVYK
jgi:predicted RNase H-like nuclease (RuvC/YqgF family)